MNTDKNKGIILVAISGVAFGLMPVFAKMAYNAGTSTITLLFLRFSVGALFMISLMIIKKMKFPSKKEMISYLLLGGVGYVGEAFCYFNSLNYASASVSSLLLYTYPAIVMLGSVIFFKENITKNKIISLILALIGAFIIAGSEFEASPIGIVLGLCASFFYAIYILVSSKVVKEGKGIESSAFIMLGAAIVFGIMNIFMGFTLPTNASGYLGAVLIALVSTVIAFYTFLTGMEKTGASTASLISILEPVVTVLCSVLLLSEPFTINILIGGIFVFAALIITSISK